MSSAAPESDHGVLSNAGTGALCSTPVRRTTGSAVRTQMTPPETYSVPQGAASAQSGPISLRRYLRACYPFDPLLSLSNGNDASLTTARIKPSDLILVHSIHANGWADGTVLNTGERGWLPTNYCETYDHPYLRNLLNAIALFSDFLGANGGNEDLSAFVRQDYIRDVITGVRYLLERADCLHRDAALVQRHSGIRRMRKGLLADLSTLVQMAKGLQDTISEPFGGEVIHVLLEELITKAFRVVIRAAGFVDIWTQETADPTLGVRQAEGSNKPTRPSVDNIPLTIDSLISQAECKAPVDSAKFCAPYIPQKNTCESMAGAALQVKDNHAFAKRLSSASPTSESSVAHQSPPVQTDRRGSVTLASETLAKAHDLCISYIGRFIGLHLHSRLSSEPFHSVRRLITACESMIAVVDQVYMRDSQRSTAVRQARMKFQENVDEFITLANDAFMLSDLEVGNVIVLPGQGDRLVNVGTRLIRSAGDCVVKTRTLIAQIGDLNLTEPLSSSCTSVQSTFRLESKNSIRSAEAQPRPRTPTLVERRLERRMLLPLPPPPGDQSNPALEAVDLALVSPTTVPDAGDVGQQLPARSHKSLPPPQRSSGAAREPQKISGELLKGRRSFTAGSTNPTRKDSAGLSVADSTSTQPIGARDSGTTAASDLSTRATTPDQAKQQSSSDPGLLNSFSSMSSMVPETPDAYTTDQTKTLQTTYDSELTLNKEGHISGGTLPALVERLTAHDAAPEAQFVSAFYITFRMFTTPRELAHALITRFDYIGSVKSVVNPVRLRIYNFFKGWLETYWNAQADRDALGDIRYFALHKLRHHLPSAGERLYDLTRKITAGYSQGTTCGPLVSGVGKTSTSLVHQQETGGKGPEPAVTKSQLNALRAAAEGQATCSIMDFDPTEVARQITLLISKIFCDIEAEELLSLDWSNTDTKKAPNVRRMCTINTDLANVVGDTILRPDDAKKRALVIKQWSKIAAGFLELNNYDSLMAIMCSINSTVVARLRRTWEAVSKNTKERLGELNAVVDSSRNQASLRRRMETPVAPCIPFLGIYLTDLTFLEAGNPKTREVPRKDSVTGETVTVINFDKHMRMAKVVSHVQRFQVPYKLQPVPEMQTWMRTHMQRMRGASDDMIGNFHRRSLVVEPRQDDARTPRFGDSASAEERPRTAGGMEKLESFLKNTGFPF